MFSRTEHPRSLEHSLKWTLGLLVLAALLAITAAGAWVGRGAAQEFVISRLAHDADALVAGLDVQGRRIDSPLPPVYAQPLSGHYYVVRFADGQALRSRSLWDQELDVASLDVGRRTAAVTAGPRDQRLLLWRAGYEKQGQPFTVAVAEDVTPLARGLNRFLWLGAAFALIAAGALILIQQWLLRREFRRLDPVRRDIRRLTYGEAEQLSESVPGEVRPLVHEFNELVSAWRAHIERSRRSVGNLAHALKTPLHLILQQGRESANPALIEQAERMRALIDRELRLARLTGSAAAARRFAPSQDIADLVQTIEALHKNKPLDFSVNIDAPEHLSLDQEDLLELIGNLLDNAAKWAARRVALRFTAGNEILLVVEDDGPGIAPAEADALLSRGSRLDEETPGHGLGLAIVSDIVRLYGGRLSLEPSASLGGLAVNVSLPLPQAKLE